LDLHMRQLCNSDTQPLSVIDWSLTLSALTED